MKYYKKVIHRMLNSLLLSSIHYGLSLRREQRFFREVILCSISRSVEDLTKTCNVKCAGQSTLKSTLNKDMFNSSSVRSIQRAMATFVFVCELLMAYCKVSFK